MGADSETSLDKFLPMPTMEEVIKEIVPMLHVRKVNGNPVVRVVLYSDDKIPPVAIDEPLYCIDGELTKNSSYFLSLNPAEVRKIKLIVQKDKLERFGILGRNGIVIVQTKRTKPEQIPNNPTIKVIGVTKPLAPVFPNYSKPANKRNPDFRPSLYFDAFQVNPKLIPSNPVAHSFYTSDDVGDYVLVVRGRTRDGDVFYIRRNFNVSF